MRVPALLVGVLSAAVGCSGAPSRGTPAAPVPSTSADTAATAVGLERELERLATSHAGAEALWPGYDPLAVPLAVYDGTRTTLFRHPSPPDGFAPDPERTGGSVFEGRYPSVTANSSADVGGVLTATVLLAGPTRSARDLAPLAVHEAFHVFQRARHPTWVGNEADLFVYPTDDPAPLALRRLETEALRRAVADPGGPARWARASLALRGRRFAALDSASVAYERGTELNEGLALYVESRAAGRPPADLPRDGFAPADVRRRAYGTGAAFAVLLDRADPAWRAPFDADPSAALDGALREALASTTSDAVCAFTSEEQTAAQTTARADVAALAAAHAADRAAFDARPGWRLVVVPASGTPLWPEGFDPVNVERVGPTDVLHARYLRLSNGAGHIEALDGDDADLASLTVGEGPHPLFHGVVRLVVAGLAGPAVADEDGTVTVRAPGLEASFTAARVAVEGQTLTITLDA